MSERSSSGGSSGGSLPQEAYAAALAGLDLMTVSRLRALLRHHRPAEAWAVALGEHPAARSLVDTVASVGDTWRTSAQRCDPAEVWGRCRDAGIGVSVLGTDAYPPVLAVDRHAPAVLFHRGDLEVLRSGRRRVGIVGTRNATAAGRSTAVAMGAGLAHAGVDVVSGLARGIDAAAHRGCLSGGDVGQPITGEQHGDGRPIAVVASGLDVPYPKENAALWDAVAESGLLIGESPPGTAPEAFRFPLRNRIIAALSEVLVVVESRATGGSLLTVEAARERQVTVLVVPGSAANAAAAGTNALARDGCGLALDVDDVLCALGLDTRRAGSHVFDPRPQPTGFDASVLEVIGSDALDLDTLVHVLARPIGEVAVSLGRLEASGWLQQTGGWFERADAPMRWR